MDDSQPITPTTASGERTPEEKKLVRQEAYRLHQQNQYENNPEYRERKKAQNREYVAKRRAAIKAERQQLVENGTITPGKPGRPRRQPRESPPAASNAVFDVNEYIAIE